MKASTPRPTCNTCPHYTAPGKPTGNCREGSPKAQFYAEPDALRPGGVNWRITGGWPPVNADQWCGQNPLFTRWWHEELKASVDAETAARVRYLENSAAEGEA